MLESWLKPEHVGFEWGAGRSTVWFSSRVSAMTSIEHDEAWYARVQRAVHARPVANVTLHCVPASESRYEHAICAVADESLDFVLVDGLSDRRDACAWAALPKIRVNGILIVDDVHRYLPSGSRAPRALPRGAAPFTKLWKDVSIALGNWTYRNFTSGVTDTGVWTRTA